MTSIHGCLEMAVHQVCWPGVEKAALAQREDSNALQLQLSRLWAGS
jgi:hypothetical protein